MLVTILNSMSGPRETYTCGQVYDVPEARALALIGRGLAAAVETAIVEPHAEVATDEPAIEMAVQPGAIEVATKRRGRPRK